jgi:pimeloyl-ACP methyl ester carboxylesterase
MTLKRSTTPLLEGAYEERGNAHDAPIILVHGFPDDARSWDAVAGPLAEEGYRTLAPYVRGYGETHFRDRQTPRSGQYTALARDIIDFADALGLRRFTLVGHDWGASAAYILAALYPERLESLVTLAVGYYGADTPKQRLAPAQARAYWYQWYFNMPQGREALAANPGAFCRHLWEVWSPTWAFDDATYAATARWFDNPDFVDIVIHSYRHRWGNAAGDPRYDPLEQRLAKATTIAVPTIMLHGADDGAALATSSAGKEKHFTGRYERRVLPGVGHFVQRECPEAVVSAVLESRQP